MAACAGRRTVGAPGGRRRRRRVRHRRSTGSGLFADGPLTPRVDTEPLLVARSDALIKDLVAPPAPSAEVCPLCHSWKPADVTSCTSCEVTGRAVGFPLGPISVVTLTAKPSPLRDWLTRYKGHPGDDDPFEQASFDRVQAVLGRYLLAHGSTLLARIGVNGQFAVPVFGQVKVPTPAAVLRASRGVLRVWW